MSSQESIHIILVEPSHPGNIGAVARAMKTMGLSKLSLVNPRKFPHQTAYDLASKADDILDNAEIFNCLEDALTETEMAVGFSARPRELDIDQLHLDDLGREVLTVAAHAKVGIVFGREHAGLTNQELSLCQSHVLIPSVPEYHSLNLSHAVQIACYELRKASLGEADILNASSKSYRKMAKAEEITGLFSHFEQTLAAIDFYNPNEPNKLMPKIKRLFNRTRLEAQDINILRGMLTAMDKCLEKGKD